MKIYRVIDDGIVKLTTANEIEAYREFYRRMQRHDNVADWGWIDEEEVK